MPERLIYSRRHGKRFVVETVLTRPPTSTGISQHVKNSTRGRPASLAQVHNFVGTETAKPRPSTQHCFVETETTKPPVTAQLTLSATLIEAFDRSDRYDGTGFFASRKDQRLDMTETAYALHRALMAGGDEAIKLAIDRFPPGLRQRAPSASKPELLAIQLTAKPRTTDERKACSALASLLVVAQALGITSEGYRAWASGIDLADAEVQARKIRVALKASAAEPIEYVTPPAKPVYAFEVAIVVDEKRKVTVRVEIEDHQIEAVRDAIVWARDKGEFSVLANKLANMMDRDGGRRGS